MTVWVVVCQISEETPIVYLYRAKELALQHAVELHEDRMVSRHARISLLQETVC